MTDIDELMVKIRRIILDYRIANNFNGADLTGDDLADKIDDLLKDYE